MAKSTETTVYLTLTPKWSRYRDREGNPHLRGMTVANMTKTRPKQAKGPVVKLTLRVPEAAFKPLAPTVVIDVPESALDYEPTVTVELPEEPADG